jgi:hypothetical protein
MPNGTMLWKLTGNCGFATGICSKRVPQVLVVHLNAVKATAGPPQFCADDLYDTSLCDDDCWYTRYGPTLWREEKGEQSDRRCQHHACEESPPAER